MEEKIEQGELKVAEFEAKDETDNAYEVSICSKPLFTNLTLLPPVVKPQHPMALALRLRPHFSATSLVHAKRPHYFSRPAVPVL